MAQGALERCPADMAIAITGVAGPDPDEDGNPVGLMHAAVAMRGAGIHHRQHSFAKAEREVLRARGIRAALELADQVLRDMPARTAGKERTA
jgi:nicotinamide-nucleotide amidase